MKYILITISLSFFCNIIKGQPIDSTQCYPEFDSLFNLSVYKIVDERPVPEIGINELYREISKTAKISSNSTRIGLGDIKIYISLIISDEGKVINKGILKRNYPDDMGIMNEQEILEYLNTIDWKPAKCKNEYVTSYFLIPISFRIH